MNYLAVNNNVLPFAEHHELFFQLREEFQQTFVIVTHNEDLAAMADRKLTMKDGIFI
jgi:lipoprotein-releasing system ATP-binding protein